MALNEAYGLTWASVVQGDRTSNTVYYKLANIVGSGTNFTELLADAFVAAVAAALRAVMADTVQLTTVYVRNQIKETENPYLKILVNLFGTVSDESMSSLTNLVIERVTATLSGKHKDLVHISGMPEAHITDSKLTTTGGIPALWDALKDALLADLTDADGNTWAPVLRTTSIGGVAQDPPVYTDLETGSVRTTARVMRSRRSVRRAPSAT